MNSPTDNLTGSNAAHRTTSASVTSISENDDVVRNLKASESVVAAFSAANFPAPPSGVADVIASYVKSATRELPMKELANMAPGSGALGSSAAVGVNMFLNMLTPTQREAAKLGVNPLDPSAMMKFSAQLNGNAAGGVFMARGQGSDGQSSGARFDTIGQSGLTQIQLQTRDYAIKQGVAWTTTNPDILKLGPAAIDIIKQTQLHKETYNALTKDTHLSSEGALGIAKAIHDNGGDTNKDGKEVAKNLKDIDDVEYTAAVQNLGKTYFKKDASQAEKDKAAEGVREAGKHAAKRHPSKAGAISQTNRAIGAAKKNDDLATRAATDAKATAGKGRAAASEDKAVAKVKQTNMRAKKADVQSKMNAF